MCDRVPLPGGGYAIVCGGRHRKPRPLCVECDLPGTRLCDGPPPAGSRQLTCDRPMCRRHVARHHPPDRDHCGICAPAVRRPGHSEELAGDVLDEARRA